MSQTNVAHEPMAVAPLPKAPTPEVADNAETPTAAELPPAALTAEAKGEEKEEKAKQHKKEKHIENENEQRKEIEKALPESKTTKAARRAPDTEEKLLRKQTARIGDAESVKTIEIEFGDDFFNDDDVSDTMTTLSTKKKYEPDEDIDQLIEFGDVYESESESDSAGSYLQQKELEIQQDFFEVLSDIPSISKLSFDVSHEESIELVYKEPALDETQQDIGYFVDPLTGERTASKEELPEPEPKQGHEPEQEEVEEEESEEDDLLLPPEIEEDVTIAKQEDDLDTWYLLDVPKIVKIADEIVDYEELARKETERKLLEFATHYLETLIDTVVDQCEYVDPNTIIRQNLDKMKLMEELQLKLGELDMEQKARYFLNRKAVDYFRRKKAYRELIDDDPDTITQVIEKYKRATAALDQALSHETEILVSTNLKIENLEREVLDKETQSMLEVNLLEDMIKKMFRSESSGHLKMIIENQLLRMQKLREEISQVRFVVIQRQHTVATLVEKTSKLEHLGSGLNMRDHEHLQTETMALGKKIEERNSDLTKCRERCNADVHIMAHMREKQQSLRSMITIQEQALEELIEERKDCRKDLFNLKMDRGKIRDEIRDLSFQGGLIDKPALMLDYDVTVDRLLIMRSKVEQMRQTHSDIQQKIVYLQEKFDRNNVEKIEE